MTITIQVQNGKVTVNAVRSEAIPAGHPTEFGALVIGPIVIGKCRVSPKPESGGGDDTAPKPDSGGGDDTAPISVIGPIMIDDTSALAP